MSAAHTNVIHVMPAQEQPQQPVAVLADPYESDIEPVVLAAKPLPADGIPVPAHAVPAVVVPEPMPPTWTTGLCSCCDDANSCLENTVCMQCQNSRQYNKLHYGKAGIEPITCLGTILGDLVCLGLTGGTMCGASMALNYHNRGYLRQRYGVDGNCCADLMASVLCTPCVTCQNYREMSARGEWSGGCCIKEPFVPRVPLAAAMGQQTHQTKDNCC